MVNKTDNTNLVSINSEGDIPAQLANNPIGDLLRYHNLDKEKFEQNEPKLIIVTCMDYRVNLKLPDKFAYIVRTASANIKGLEFKLSFALSMKEIKHVVLIGHTDCGMVNLSEKRDKVSEGLKKLGWTNELALEHFDSHIPKFEIKNEADFVQSECNRLKEKYSTVTFVPMIYKVEDNKIYIVGQ